MEQNNTWETLIKTIVINRVTKVKLILIEIWAARDFITFDFLKLWLTWLFFLFFYMEDIYITSIIIVIMKADLKEIFKIYGGKEKWVEKMLIRCLRLKPWIGICICLVNMFDWSDKALSNKYQRVFCNYQM